MSMPRPKKVQPEETNEDKPTNEQIAEAENAPGSVPTAPPENSETAPVESSQASKKGSRSDEGKAALQFLVDVIEELAYEQARSPSSGSGWLENLYAKMKEFNKANGLTSKKYTM